MGFVRKTIGSVTGANDAADAASAAAATQEQLGQQAIDLQRETIAQQRQDLAPFVGPGARKFALASDFAGNVPGFEVTPFTPAGQLSPTAQIGAPSPTVSPQAISPQFDVTSDPTFQALANEAQRRVFSNQAARGKLGSGGTAEALQERLVALGDQLSTSNLQRQLAARGQLVGEQQAQFGQQLTGQQLTDQQRQALFNQQLVGQQQRAAEQAQQFGQQVQAGLIPQQTQQQAFNQLLEIGRIGQASAAGQAAAAGTGGARISDLLTQIGNVRAAGITAPAAIQQQSLNSALQLGGQLGSAALLASDYRLKENISYRETINGIPMFNFDYIDGPKNQTGTMAQLIQDDYPEAIHHVDGYLWVDYGKLPIWH